MVLGPFLFAAPLALLGLLALPVIWWLLRATPPMPREAELPSLRLLDDLDPSEETPARTPWWVLALRLTAAGLAALGLAQPIYAPGAKTAEEAGALLIVMDDGWRSAPRWRQLSAAVDGALDTANRDTPTHLLLTAPRGQPIDPAERLNRGDMARRVASLDPAPWAPDRVDALARLEASGLEPARIFWASDGLDAESGETFAAALQQIAPLTVFAAPPRGAAAIDRIAADNVGASARLARADASGAAQAFVSALSRDGAALATASATFEPGETMVEARFDLPPAALARADRFRIVGGESAGAVFLWDSAARRQRVGLVSSGETAQPLLSDLHYVRRALEPFALIQEGGLDELLDARPDAIVMTDIGRAPDTLAVELRDWIEAGGALIRFAGPRLAAQADDFTPTPLRRSERALGGALAWEEPLALAEFPAASPFAGLAPPEDVKVRRQVLARPSADLDARTWARLEDGSPLVTADRRGRGAVVLFHVTASPDWSDLPYSGVFVDLLRRAGAAGRGEAVEDADGLYAPSLTLDGFGRLRAPPDTAAPARAAEFSTLVPSETHPPGLYQGPAGSRAVNAGPGATLDPIRAWPAGATLLGDAEARALPLAGLLIAAALALLAIDLMVALAAAGRLPALRRSVAAIVLTAAAMGAAPGPDAYAQATLDDLLRELERDRLGQESEPGFNSGPLTIYPRRRDRTPAHPALALRFGYIPTGDAALDRRTELGLDALSDILFDRTSVEPKPPDALDLETDPLELYPLIYFAVPDEVEPFSPAAAAKLNAYMRSGGSLIVDTRRGGQATRADMTELEPLLNGLDAPALAPTPRGHVITRSFYLIDAFPGRFGGGRLWIEAPAAADAAERRGDGVSRLFVGDADWAGAWARDDRGYLAAVDGGEPQREQAYRFGVNLVMYVLTGSYKEDQVHLPALLERLGEDGGELRRPPETPN